MSLPAQKSKNDYNKYLNSYLATLNQSIQNNDLVYNAVSANLAGDMMAVPQMPQDTRSVEDKLRDIENLKVQLQSQLLSLTDGKTANEIVRELNDFEIQQAVQSFPSLYTTLKPLWSMGVPSVIFVQALRNLAQKQDLTAGIEMNMQQGNADTLQLSPQQLGGLIDAGDLNNLMGVAQELPPRQRQGLLSQISYVKQLLFDKGDLPNRIERARQLEAESGIDQSIPESVQDFLITKGDFNVELNELNEAIANGNASDRDRTLKNIMDALNLPQDVIADLEEFDFNPYSTPSQKPEPSVKLQRKRLATKLGARRGQAGAEEEKGQTQAEIAQAQAVEATKPAQVFSEKAPKIAKAFQEGSDEDLLQRLINKSDSSERNKALTELEVLNRPFEIDGIPISKLDLRKTGSGNKYGNPTTVGYWERTNVFELNNQLQQLLEAQRQAKPESQPKSEGKGLRRMSGRGVSFNISEEPQTKPKSIKLKIAGVIEKEPSYVPFGRYAVNRHKLASDIFMLRTPKGGAIPRLLTQKLSNKLCRIIKTIADKGTPSFEAIGDLDTLDKEILHKILQESQISSISTPNPSRDQDEKDHRRFLILKGELIAGNNNPALAKELKRLIIKLMSREILPRREAQNALVELAMLETI